MAMTVPEASEKGTETFNAHDIDGFAEVLADDVGFQAPGGVPRTGRSVSLDYIHVLRSRDGKH